LCTPFWALVVVVVAAGGCSPDEFGFDRRHRLRCFPLSMHRRLATPIITLWRPNYVGSYACSTCSAFFGTSLGQLQLQIQLSACTCTWYQHFRSFAD